MTKRYTFFFNNQTPFSQWYPCKFVVGGKEFNCAEQYMMYMKALTFGDSASADQIMTTDVPWLQKKLGRAVVEFDVDKWVGVREIIVKDGNRAKFLQNKDLREALLATAGTTLVEASPYDCIWGIGLGMDDPKKEDPANWRGLNLLGKALTEVREEFLKENK